MAWIDQTRSLLPDLRLTAETGPIVEDEMVAGRWVAEGTYRGGVPGSTATPGTSVRFHGNGIWRAEGGLIREYWLSDDLLDLMQQLGGDPGRLDRGHVCSRIHHEYQRIEHERA